MISTELIDVDCNVGKPSPRYIRCRRADPVRGHHPELTATVTRSFLASDEVVFAPSIAEAKAKLAKSSFDVVLVDYDLDDGKGDELVRWLLLACRTGSKIIGVSARDVGNEALLAAGAHATCPKLRFSQIQTVLRDVLAKAP